MLNISKGVSKLTFTDSRIKLVLKCDIQCLLLATLYVMSQLAINNPIIAAMSRLNVLSLFHATSLLVTLTLTLT